SIRSASECHSVSVALDQPNLIEGYSEPIGDALGIGRRVRLAMCKSTRNDGHCAGGVEAQLHPVIKCAGILDVRDKGAAAQLTLARAGLAPTRIRLPIREPDASLCRGEEIAAVVDETGR